MLGDLFLRRQDLWITRFRVVDKLGQGGEYGLDHQVGHHRQRSAVQVLPSLHPRKVGGKVVADILAQAGNGLAHGL
ncbi:hypothetical protein BGP83_03625 [Pseudomonas putida]|nr:hypothetical protein BGP83_03625 [Pseudomonas putida]